MTQEYTLYNHPNFNSLSTWLEILHAHCVLEQVITQNFINNLRNFTPLIVIKLNLVIILKLLYLFNIYK